MKEEFDIIIRNKNRGTKITFIVRQHLDNPLLIGRDKLIELGMILESTVNLKEKNELRIKRIRGARIPELAKEIRSK